MKIGIEELKGEFKSFFSKKDFIWFERKDLRDENLLDMRDIKWLRGWTIAPIGFANIFYICSSRRKLLDILVVSIITYLFFEIHEAFLYPLFVNESMTALTDKYPFGILAAAAYQFLVAIPFLIASLYTLYFVLRHGKRLAWNRGNWTSVEELRKNEKKWLYFNTLPSLTVIVLLFFFLF